jgi:hypothetical protein
MPSEPPPPPSIRGRGIGGFMGGRRDANDRVVWLLPGMTFEEAVRHIAKVDEDVTYSVDVRPEEARELLAGLKRSKHLRIRHWNARRSPASRPT